MAGFIGFRQARPRPHGADFAPVEALENLLLEAPAAEHPVDRKQHAANVVEAEILGRQPLPGFGKRTAKIIPRPDQRRAKRLRPGSVEDIGEGRLAGSITAAQFLQRFVNDKPWVHIDIAGTGMWSGSKDARLPTFGTGYGVRLLDRFVSDNYEA